jgi:hypothetical protein
MPCSLVYVYLLSPERVNSILQEATSQNKFDIGSEILKAVVMKASVFWDISPCGPLKINRRFGVTYNLHPQGSAC